MNRSPRGAILDVDGTLVDSNDAHARAWVESLERGGFTVPFDKVRRLIGMGSDNLLPETAGLEKDTPQGKQMGEWWKEIFVEKYLPGVRPFPRTRELLERMRRDGLRLVVASSGETEVIEPLLELAGAKDLLDETTSSSDASNSKPDPDIIEAALKRVGLAAAEAIMLGDTPYDVQAATRAGVRVVALRCGGWSDADLAGAVAVYDDPADLLAHYDGSPFARPAAEPGA